MRNELSRRDLISAALLAGTVLMLGGCQTTRRGGKLLPGPIWPDERPEPTPKLSAGGGSGSLVPVIGRTQWASSGPRTSLANPMNGITRITVHHAAMVATAGMPRDSAARMIESIRREHASRKDQNTGAPWADIGYHYIIDPAGRVWEGRPTNLQGAHVRDTNQHNLGIMLLGNFDQQRPSAEALGVLDRFVAEQMRKYRVSLGRVYTHQELGQSRCPGVNLQSYMVQTRGRSGRLAVAHA